MKEKELQVKDTNQLISGTSGEELFTSDFIPNHASKLV
jgi:hypothetical protein